MKVLIISYNRLTYLRQMVDWCKSVNLEPVIIDNASNYKPLLEYYATNPCEIFRCEKNFGHRVVWITNVLDALKIRGSKYIVTDPDLDMTGVPADVLNVLIEGLAKYPNYSKCGLSLEINDLPENEYTKQIIYNCESRYWTKPLDSMFYEAETDTTFALYRANIDHYTLDAIRTNRPYTAKHFSWYYEKWSDLPADEQHYFESASRSSSGRSRIMELKNQKTT